MTSLGTADPHMEENRASELYFCAAVADGVTSLDAIGDPQCAEYREQGFLVVHAAFSPEEVKAAKDGLTHLIMGGSPAFEGVEFEAKAADRLPAMSLDERQDAVRKLMWFTPHEPRLNALAAHPKLLAVIARLLDARPEMFQDMALLKPPQIGREKPWHQDKAYFDYPLGTPVVGVWIALDEASRENGCMHLLPGEHRAGPLPHFQRRDWQICDTEMLGRPCVAAPMKPGGLLLFDGLLPHGTPNNLSSQRRRALQFHYAPAGVALAATEERLAVFGSEGRNALC